MHAEDSFADLMVRLRDGDPEAARQVFNRFARRLIALARGRLEARLREKVEPEDVLQSAYRSFFCRYADGQFELHDWDSLWALLTTITLRKCGRWTDHYHAARRDISREIVPCAAVDDSESGWQALTREPSPDEGALLAETVEGLLRGQEGRDRDIVSLALVGYKAREISAQLNRPPRTVYRVLERVKKRLQRLRDGAEH